MTLPQPDTSILDDNPVGLVLMGKRAAGKSFASGRLVSAWGATAWTVAERIKQISHALIDQNGPLGDLLSVVLPEEGLGDEATRQLLRYADTYEPEAGAKPIRLYQDIGEILRHLDPSSLFCWEEDLQRRIEANPSALTVVDLRAKESFDFFVVQRRYSSVLVTAPDAVRERRMAIRDRHVIVDPAATGHVSETDVDNLDFEFVVNNDSDDPTRLYGEMDAIVRTVAERNRAAAASRDTDTA